MPYWQDNAHKNNNCYWYSILIKEHSPKQNETTLALKNVVFDINTMEIGLNACFSWCKNL